MRMRHLPMVMAVAAIAACQPSAPPTGSQRARIIAQADSAVAALYDAMNVHDTDAVMAHYLLGDDFLYVGVSDVLQGHDTFARTMAPWYRAHPDVTFDFTILHTQVLSPTTATVTVKASTQESPYLTTTRTLVQLDGKWLVALEHESWPGAEVPGAVHPGTETPGAH